MIGQPTRALLVRDIRAVVRDPFLLFLIAYGALLALIARLAGPYIPITDIELYLAPAVVILAALLGGAVLGFSLVEEREQQTWLLFRVLPAGGTTFALYLITTTLLVALVCAALAAAVYGRPVANAGIFAVSLLAAAAGAPVYLLFLGSFASNKIEAMAMAMYKIGGSASAIPFLIFLIPANAQWALWWNPWYWTYLGLLQGYASPVDLRAAGIPILVDAAWPYSVVPILLCAAASAVFARRYRRLVP